MATRRSIVGAARPSRLPVAAAIVLTLALPGCSLLATPRPPAVRDASLAPTGPVGYVVCPSAVTPVELDTATPEAAIALPLPRPPSLGNFAIAASPDGRWAYVVTTVGGTAPPAPAASSTSSSNAPSSTTTPGPAVYGEVIPIDLVGQRAGRPLPLPGLGGTHAIVVLPGGRTVLAGVGTAIVPIDTVTRRVGAPIDLGAGHTVFGMALAPDGKTLYTLVPGGVFAVNTGGSAGPEIPTGLAISSVYSPHGIAVTDDGGTVYVVGQGGTDFGGRVLPIVTATRATLPSAGFDRYGIADPAALALSADGSSLLVVDNANNWVNPVDNATFADPPPPVRLPQRSGGSPTSGTAHPTDIVLGPGGTGAFIVDGFTSVIPYRPATQTFGRPVTVCSGASSMAIAPAP
jgi:hypothetical protein